MLNKIYKNNRSPLEYYYFIRETDSKDGFSFGIGIIKHFEDSKPLVHERNCLPTYDLDNDPANFPVIGEIDLEQFILDTVFKAAKESGYND